MLIQVKFMILSQSMIYDSYSNERTKSRILCGQVIRLLKIFKEINKLKMPNALKYLNQFK